MMVSMFMLRPFASEKWRRGRSGPRAAAERWQVRTLASVRGRTHTQKKGRGRDGKAARLI
jgi:hypothetical protein